MSDEADEKAATRAEDARRLARHQRATDFRAVMDLPAGRRFVWRYLNELGVFSGSYAPGDALATAYNEGRRAAGLQLQVELQRLAAPQYVRMLTEAVQQVELDAELLPEE